MEARVAMQNERRSEGFSLLQAPFAMGVLITAGILGAAGVLAAGTPHRNSSPADVIVTQEAAEAIEGVLAARDSHRLDWSKIKNVHGASGTDNGVFLDGPQPLSEPGSDGLLNTADDAALGVDNIPLPGPDKIFGTADDDQLTLSSFTREITIRDVPNEGGQLRSITVRLTYRAGATERAYTLVTYISVYA
jgi:hypothetical protein